MITHNYYFVSTSLPVLVLGEPPEITFEEFEFRLRMNLSKKDIEKMEVLKRYIDLLNIRSFLQEAPLDPRGNLTEKELDEALLIQDFLPEYVFEFLEKYEHREDRIRNFFALLSRFFSEESQKQSSFLSEYLKFEREWRLVVLALRAKQLKRDVAYELRFEDPNDFLVAHILNQREGDDYEPPKEYVEVKEIFLACGEDPWQQFRAFAQYRFKKIEELASYPLFDIDWILGYMARLLIVEQWNELDIEEGKRIVQQLKTG